MSKKKHALRRTANDDAEDAADEEDQESTSDTFKWVIHQARLKQIITSSQRTQFTSDKVRIGKITFQILGIPQYDTNMFQLYLMVVDISSEWHTVIVSAALSCKETLCGDANIFNFNAASSFRAQSWCPSCLCIDDIVARKLSQLTLSVHVSLLQIVSRQRRVVFPSCVSSPRLKLGQKLEWRVHEQDLMLAEMKRSLYGKSFISSINHHFCVKLFPNGYQKIGAVHIELQWLGTPHSLNGRLCKWKFSLAEAALCVQGEHRFSLDAPSIHLKTSALTFNKLRQFTTLSMLAEFEVVSEQQQQQQQQQEEEEEELINVTDNFKQYHYVAGAGADADVVATATTAAGGGGGTQVVVPSPSPRSLASTEAMVKHNRQSILTVSQYFTDSVNKLFADLQCLRQAVHQQHQHNKQCVSQLSQQVVQLSVGQRRYEAQLSDLQQQLRALRASNAASPRQLPLPTIGGDIGSEHSAIRHWLTTKVKLPQYFTLFIEHGYDDMDVLLDVTEDDLVAMGVDKIGHRKKIMKHVNVQNYPSVESGSAEHSVFSASDHMLPTNHMPYSPHRERASVKQKTTPRSRSMRASNDNTAATAAAAAAAAAEFDFDIDVDVDFDGTLADIHDVINSVL